MVRLTVDGPVGSYPALQTTAQAQWWVRQGSVSHGVSSRLRNRRGEEVPEQHADNLADRNPGALHARLAVADIWIDGNPVEGRTGCYLTLSLLLHPISLASVFVMNEAKWFLLHRRRFEKLSDMVKQQRDLPVMLGHLASKVLVRRKNLAKAYKGARMMPMLISMARLLLRTPIPGLRPGTEGYEKWHRATPWVKLSGRDVKSLIPRWIDGTFFEGIEDSIAMPCSVKTNGSYRRPPQLETTICDLKFSVSSFASWNMKSSGKRSGFVLRLG